MMLFILASYVGIGAFLTSLILYCDWLYGDWAKMTSRKQFVVALIASTLLWPIGFYRVLVEMESQ